MLWACILVFYVLFFFLQFFICFFHFFLFFFFFFFFSSRRRHTRLTCDWSSDVCSSDLTNWSIGFVTSRLNSSPGPSGTTLTPDMSCSGTSSKKSAGRVTPASSSRSEERRVGKECRSRGSPYHEKKKEREYRRKGEI